MLRKLPYWLGAAAAGLLVACGAPTPADPTARPAISLDDPATTLPPLPVLGPAPAINNEQWLNTSEALTLAQLRGKVVLVEFWTFGCINCQRVAPYLNAWYEKYGGEAFEIVGVHYPEFRYEEDIANVQAALERLEIHYPVAIDNDGQTWRAYQQRYWPTRYLIDRDGNLRYKHIGEGAYTATELYIQALLREE